MQIQQISLYFLTSSCLYWLQDPDFQRIRNYFDNREDESKWFTSEDAHTHKMYIIQEHQIDHHHGGGVAGRAFQAVY